MTTRSACSQQGFLAIEDDAASSKCRTLALVASAGALLATTNQGSSVLVATAALLCVYDAVNRAYRSWALRGPSWQLQESHAPLAWSHRRSEASTFLARCQVRTSLRKQRKLKRGVHMKLFKRERSAKRLALRRFAALEKRITANIARFERVVETLEAWSSCTEPQMQQQLWHQQQQDASEPWWTSRIRDSSTKTESIASEEDPTDFEFAPGTPPSRVDIGNGRLSESSPMQKLDSFSFGCPQ